MTDKDISENLKFFLGSLSDFLKMVKWDIFLSSFIEEKLQSRGPERRDVQSLRKTPISLI